MPARRRHGPTRSLALLLAVPGIALAGEADVTAVDVARTARDTYRFDVTVHHDDTGWDHYADRWDIVAPDGTVLATRELFHPHTGEQPFTRTLSGASIPAGIDRVTVRAHDSVHGYGGRTMSVRLPGRP